MAEDAKSDYDAYAASSPARFRALRRERLVLEVTEALCEALAGTGISQAALARRLGKSQPAVSKMLSGRSNMSAFMDLADMATAMGYRVEVSLHPDDGCRHPLLEKLLALRQAGTALVSESRALEQEWSGGNGDEPHAAAVKSDPDPKAGSAVEEAVQADHAQAREIPISAAPFGDSAPFSASAFTRFLALTGARGGEKR